MLRLPGSCRGSCRAQVFADRAAVPGSVTDDPRRKIRALQLIVAGRGPLPISPPLLVAADPSFPASADPHAARYRRVCPDPKVLRDSNPYWWRACGHSRQIPPESIRRPTVVPRPGHRTTSRPGGSNAVCVFLRAPSVLRLISARTGKAVSTLARAMRQWHEPLASALVSRP